MPFGLTNALEVSMDLMNRVCKSYMDTFVIVFIYDIFIYSRRNKEYEEHLRLILKSLKNKEFYAKFSKYEFWLPKVKFLVHVVDSQGIHEDSANKDTPTTTTPTKIRQFLGIKRRRRALSSDGVRKLATVSGPGRLKEDLESSTWRWRQDYKATPDYSKPSHEGYRNTIEILVENNVVPLRSDTIRLVQNGCSFHGLQSEDPNQHLKDFLKLVDSLYLDARSITTWEDLATRFLAQLFPPGRTVKICNDILMFQQHHGESLSEAWTHFKDLLQKDPYHGIELWLQVQIFYDHVNLVTRRTIDQSTNGKLRD
nr:putative reverse transcriptase domain-containing protein [Tanacetum cinerariifolium]